MRDNGTCGAFNGDTHRSAERSQVACEPLQRVDGAAGDRRVCKGDGGHHADAGRAHTKTDIGGRHPEMGTEARLEPRLVEILYRALHGELHNDLSQRHSPR